MTLTETASGVLMMEAFNNYPNRQGPACGVLSQCTSGKSVLETVQKVQHRGYKNLQWELSLATAVFWDDNLAYGMPSNYL